MANKHRGSEELTIRKRKRTPSASAARVKTSGSVVDLKRIAAQRAVQEDQERARRISQRGFFASAKELFQEGAQDLRSTFNVSGRIRTAAEKRNVNKSQKVSKEERVAEPALKSEPAQKKQKKSPAIKQSEPVLITNALTDERVLRPRHEILESVAQWFKKYASFFTGAVAAVCKRATKKLTPEQRRAAKPLMQFIMLLLVIIIPVSAYVVTSSVHTQQAELEKIAAHAFTSLTNASDQVQKLDTDNIKKAEQSLLDAQNDFSVLNKRLGGFTGMLISVGKYLPGKGKEAAAARDLAHAGTEITAAAISLLQTQQKLSKNTSPSEVLAQTHGVITTIDTIHSDLMPAATHIHTASVILSRVPVTALPKDKQALVQKAKDQVPVLDSLLTTVTHLAGVAPEILGKDGERKYMVLFQNNRELRPTGGFIGSFAQISVRDGLVTQLSAPGGGIYDVAGQLKTNVVSPEPLHLVNPAWNIQDANWFPSFPDSAKKVEWFYERSNGSTLDGVVTLTPDVIQNILLVTGPIDMQAEYGVTVNANNVYELLQARNAENPDDDQPKKLIADLTPKLLNAVITAAQDPGQAVHLLALLKQSLDAKDILLFFNNEAAQKVISEADWAGEVQKTEVGKDYLYINHANIAGGKTDAVIDESIAHHTDIADDGTITDTVTITRVHKGQRSDELENVLNVSFVRAYVPEGSTLISAEGFVLPPPQQFLAPDSAAKTDADYKRISGNVQRSDDTHLYTNTEYGKVVFGGFMRTSVGESSTVTLKYTLPFKLHTTFWKPVDTYSLDVQKQPGMKAPFFTATTTLPKTFEALTWFPTENEVGNYQLLLTDDTRTGVIVTPHKK